MSIKSIFTKRNIFVIFIVTFIAIIISNQYLSSLKKNADTITNTVPLATESAAKKSIYDTSDTPETELEAFLKEYQFMFYHLPKTENATSVGWDNDIPLAVQDNKIINAISSESEKEFQPGTITILNSEGEALAIDGDQSSLYNNRNKTESTISPENKEAFTYIWYKKPNIHIILSQDNKTIFLRDTKSNQTSLIQNTQTEINPLSISTNGNKIAFTDKDNLYLSTPYAETKKTTLSKSTIQAITFWLKDDLFIVQKVEIPRLLDFIMHVDQNDLSYKQIITSSSIINRLDLNIHPAVNKKQDMVIFAENNGLAWVLSKDQAITRIFPGLKLPPEMWEGVAP